MSYKSSDIKTCALGDETSSRVAILWGNSHADQWKDGLSLVLKARGLKLIPVNKAGCLLEVARPDTKLSERSARECETWRRNALAYADSLNPEFIILSNSVDSSISDSENANRTIDYFKQLSVITYNLIYIVDTPRHSNGGPACLARAAWQGNSTDSCTSPLDSESRNASDAVVNALRDHTKVSILDLTDQFCPNRMCNTITDGVVMYRDEHHITSTFARKLAPVLGQRLDSLLQRMPAVKVAAASQ